MTGQQLVTAALQLIGVASPADGDPESVDSNVAIEHAARMVKSWNAQDYALFAIARQTFTWTASQSSRTIGPSGNFSFTPSRPLEILAARLIPVGQTYEVTLRLISHAEYSRIGDKTQTGDYMTDLLFEPTEPNATLTAWPVPTTAPTLVLHMKTLLADLALGTEISAPTSYEAALVSQLAKRIAPIFGKPWTRELDDLAREDFAVMKRANVRVPDVRALPAELNGSAGWIRPTDFDAGQF